VSEAGYTQALERIRQARERRTRTLVLSGLGLTTLPDALWGLTWLEMLDISGNRLTALPESLGRLQNLQRLALFNNRLTALPESLGRLQNLQWLDLSRNRLTALPESLGRLQNLQGLYLPVNRLTALPESLGRLQNLQWLDLSRNRLTALPESLGRLQNLQWLDLSRNRLTALPESLGRLQHLQWLNLSDNPLEELPTFLWDMAQLEMLGLANLGLETLPESLGRLQNLQHLDLSDNRLTALPESLGRLQHLQWLYLSRNRLTALPESLGRLQHLQRLALQGNPLTLTLPHRLIGDEYFGDAQAILDFYRAVWQEGQTWGAVRVLFVGQPGVGKTSLVRRLKDGSFDPRQPSTLVVETHTLPLGPYTAHLWDFGGQEFMHATHPFFFSARVVYVLVLNVRHTAEQNRVRYWLDLIRSMGGDAPVLIVGNHADADQHRLDLPFNALREQYPNIQAYLQTSAKEGAGLEALRQALHTAVENLPHVRVRFARSHLAVKDALETRKAQGEDLIPREAYRAICRAQGIDDEQDQETLLALLHDLGVVLDFRDEAGEPLTPEGVLNPNWVTSAVYRVLTAPEVRERSRGRVTPTMIRRILSRPRYQQWHRELVLRLMQRFELAYPGPDGAWWLPDVMPQDQPEAAAAAAWDDALVFEYAYDPRLPPGVITRFIVRAHEAIADQALVWRWGVILRLQQDANRALVRARPERNTVEIRVTGRPNTRREALAYIRGHFEAIHRTFVQQEGGFTITAYLSPPRYPGLRLPYDDLLVLEKDGIAEYPVVWQGRTVYLPVREVLDGFVSPQARQEEIRARFPHEARREMVVSIQGNVTNSILTLGDANRIAQRIQTSPLAPELAQALTELAQAVQALLPHLPPEQQEEVQDDLQRLQEELQRPEPRRKWYTVSLEGLKAAAKTVGEIGLPVLKLVEQIVRLLS